jgi:hypothetical protein
MRTLTILLLFISISFCSRAQPLLVDLSHAIKTSLVNVTATTTGKIFRGKGLKINISNKSGRALRVKMNNGVIFKPDSSGVQPLVLAGEEMLIIEPFKQGSIEAQTFCANSNASAPSLNLGYSFSHVGSDTLINLLLYLKKNNMLDELGQSAVWVLTNNHSLNNVYDPYRDNMSKKLIEYLSTVTGLPKPDYYTTTTMSQNPGAPVYIPKVLKIYAEFEQTLASPQKITLGVFNEEGTMIQPVFVDRNFGKATHRHRVEFEASGVRPGNYYIRLKSGDEVLQEKKVVVQ